MASTMPFGVRRSSPLRHEWQPRQMVDDNFRKTTLANTSPAKPTPDCCCRDDQRLPPRYDETKTSDYRHQSGTQSDHELYKLSEERTSDEGSITEVEEINDNARGDVQPTYRSFDSGPRKYDKSRSEYPSHAYGNASESHQTAQYEKVDDEDRSDPEEAGSPTAAVPTPYQRNLRDWANSVNLSEALIAMKKLERLKDLQRRRDLSERFYSQEIKRLLGEHFFSKNSATDPSSEKTAESGNRAIGDTSAPGEQRIRAGGFSKELQPCGTMTTITRLDCGCVRETTIPIYNSSVGHVKKCEGHRYANSQVTKLTSSNPQELAYRSMQPLESPGNVASSPTRAKARFTPDCATYQKLESVGSRDLESWQDRRSHSAQPRTRISPKHISPMRNPSPVRKYSETSSNSLRE